MRKIYILIFSLVFASFSCATLDSNLKENSSVEKGAEVSNKKTEMATLELPSETKDIEHSNDSKESLTLPEKSGGLDSPNLQKDEKKSSDSSHVDRNREDSKREEKRGIDEKSSKDKEDTSLKPKNEAKRNEKENTISSNKSTENKEARDALENRLADESALQEYDDVFLKLKNVESQKKEKQGKDEEKKTILSSLEILKELEDAINIFQKAIPNIAKQRVEKQEKDSRVEIVKQVEEPKDEVTTPELATKNEDSLSDTPTIANLNDDATTSNFNDEDSQFGFNEEEPLFDFSEEEHQFTFNDEEPEFSFDSEKKGDTSKAQSKDGVQDNRGQLSSVVDEEDKVNISRYTNILKGQNIDFSYPGEGWVYLGEETSQKGLSYIKRKMEDGKTFFTFTAENEGNYVLNFSYFDVFSGDFIVDAVSVKVVPNNDGVQKDALVLEYQKKNERKETEGQARKTPNEVNVDADKVGINTESIEKKEETSTKQPSSSVVQNESLMETLKPATPTNRRDDSSYKEPEVVTNIASITPENAKTKISGEDAKKIIDEVSQEISNGNAKRALERLDDFFANSSTNIDEAYFLRGKAYELNTDLKNIKMALASYKFLTKTFPNSPRWNEADARIRYIEKFFVKIK